MDVVFVHDVTDSPSSQEHPDILSAGATPRAVGDCRFLALLRGRTRQGACDGGGGDSKRMADDYVRRGNAILTVTSWRGMPTRIGSL